MSGYRLVNDYDHVVAAVQPAARDGHWIAQVYDNEKASALRPAYEGGESVPLPLRLACLWALALFVKVARVAEAAPRGQNALWFTAETLATAPRRTEWAELRREAALNRGLCGLRRHGRHITANLKDLKEAVATAGGRPQDRELRELIIAAGWRNPRKYGRTWRLDFKEREQEDAVTTTLLPDAMGVDGCWSTSWVADNAARIGDRTLSVRIRSLALVRLSDHAFEPEFHQVIAEIQAAKRRGGDE